MDFDAIVIGSGFGGSVSACRLAEAGYRVLVLERGRRWDAKTYPRKDDDPWWFSNERARAWNGWFDLRVFKHMAVAAGRGRGRRLARLRQHLGSARQVDCSTRAGRRRSPGRRWRRTTRPWAAIMNVQQVPDNQWPKQM